MRKVNIVKLLVNVLSKHGINVSPLIVYLIVLVALLVILILSAVGLIEQGIIERILDGIEIELEFPENNMTVVEYQC